MSGLGRVLPPDFSHVEKYPLFAAGVATPITVPVVLGINWYTAFDTPVQDGAGNYWIAKAGRLGTIRGGHCLCVEPDKPLDLPVKWWRFYNQGLEGACVGFGSSRAMSLLNRRSYQAFWLYRQAQILEGDPPGSDGAQVRSGLEVLRTLGNVHAVGKLQMTDATISKDTPVAGEGIKAYRWARTVDEILTALGTPSLDYVTLLNSWGTAYPHRVRVPATVIDRLLQENGEAGVVVDR